MISRAKWYGGSKRIAPASHYSLPSPEVARAWKIDHIGASGTYVVALPDPATVPHLRAGHAWYFLWNAKTGITLSVRTHTGSIVGSIATDRIGTVSLVSRDPVTWTLQTDVVVAPLAS